MRTRSVMRLLAMWELTSPSKSDRRFGRALSWRKLSYRGMKRSVHFMKGEGETFCHTVEPSELRLKSVWSLLGFKFSRIYGLDFDHWSVLQRCFQSFRCLLFVSPFESNAHPIWKQAETSNSTVEDIGGNGQGKWWSPRLQRDSAYLESKCHSFHLLAWVLSGASWKAQNSQLRCCSVQFNALSGQPKSPACDEPGILG